MRRRYSREQWLEWIERHRSSGMSVVEFCDCLGIPQSSFHRWRKKLRDDLDGAKPDDGGPSPEFVPVSVVDDGRFDVELPGEITLRIPACHENFRSVLAVLVQLAAEGELGRGDRAC